MTAYLDPTSMRVYELFGGAITVSLAGDYLDASNFRQVPDNQEVLLSNDAGVSVIVEVLQCVSTGTDESVMDHAVRYHFDSLAHDNSALKSEVAWVDAPSAAAPEGATPTPALLQGVQRVQKFGKAENESDVNIYVAVWRLPSKNVDLVMSLNDPERTSQSIGEAFRAAAASLRIRDWGLFA